VLAVLSAWSCHAFAQRTDPNEWTPDEKTVTRVDAMALKLELPKEFGSISYYSRFYYGTVRSGHKVIEGIFLSPLVQKAMHRNADSGIHVVPESMAVGIADGGCMEVNLEFDVQSEKIESHCNFELRVPPPPLKENSN
jgi:hypothetical protein